MANKNIEDMTDEEWEAKKQEMISPARKEATDALVEKIAGYMRGFDVDFSIIHAQLGSSPEHHWRIAESCRYLVKFWTEHLQKLDREVFDLSSLQNEDDYQERYAAIEEGSKLRAIAKTKETGSIQFWWGETFQDGKKVIKDENGKEIRREVVLPSENFQKWFSASGVVTTNPIAGDGMASVAPAFEKRPVPKPETPDAKTPKPIKR
jgi:hypothetical protein